ncbi:MAG TPA: carbamoyl phosphate synthase large subunit [Bacillales bacterium]|nr:carbamoyl phosphate synthase large subunit [Bacillales bacterium]
MPMRESIRKVLVIGSGPIVIGQAAEFDYAGTQACLALKEEGCQVVLVNNNPATIMTDERVADTVYFEPLTVESIEKVIQKEQPDGLLATLGGQTGLNLAFDLHKAGILQKYEVKLLGTDIDSIMKGEDREAFRALMYELGEPVPESENVATVEAALAFVNKIGYPVIIRPAYTLGGSGGGFAHNEHELAELTAGGLKASPIHQCLIEKSIAGFKEIEYEVMRDENDTCITVCNMENVDPVGVHTGDSIVVAPSQTLTDWEYHKLRAVSLKIVRALGVIGGCNIQLALDPNSSQYYLIEVNPRVSRSSALASKATGYPIAKIAAKLSLGYHLHEIINPVTGNTYASFEPALDYAVVKFPRWPFDKFPEADRTLGTQMKATGEVMAIERNLESAFQKAVRSLEIDIEGLEDRQLSKWTEIQLWENVEKATDRRFFAILELLRRDTPIEVIQDRTKISLFFLASFERLVQLEKKARELSLNEITSPEFLSLKQHGFTDGWLASVWETDEHTVREKRKRFGIFPSYKIVDTCAAEFEAESAYYYSSWSGRNDVRPNSEKNKMLVIGSGPIRIGQGIEFDYCSVHAVQALQAEGYETIIVNNNPETVSTDHTLADRLYFEPLALEDVLNVIEFEEVESVVVQVGGQTSISLVEGLQQAGVKVLGVSQDTIDEVEDRDLFYQLMEKHNIPHIPGLTAIDDQDLIVKASEVGYPVLLRPSYVIGGRGMVVLSGKEELKHFIEKSLSRISYPILIDAYVPGTEAEVDVITDGKEILIPGIFEHVEKAGVHSGDSTAATPPPTISASVKNKLVDYTRRIARAINLKGIFNIQFVIDEDRVYVLEINPRASRTVPILSKVYGIDMIGTAVKLMLGQSLKDLNVQTGLWGESPYFTAKAPVFSTIKLPGVDPLIGPEMQSTGEVIAISKSADAAIHQATGNPMKPGDEVFCDLSQDHWEEFMEISDRLNAAGAVLVSDQKRFSRCLGLTYVASFEKWQQGKQAAALISIGEAASKKKRLKAVRNRLSVWTEWPQVKAHLPNEKAEKELYSIGEWLRKKEGSLVH